MSHHVHDDVAQGSVVKDPVCGMDVDPASAAHRVEHDGHEYFFCSEHCRAKFEADPSSYLQPATSAAAPRAAAPGSGEAVEWTCPMHPEIRRPGPGACPICGMALEPVTATADSGPSPELADMTRRFWIGLALTVPVLVLGMGGELLPSLHDYISERASTWVQLVLATPVVLWAGWPFFVRGWTSVRTMKLNMFTLIAMGTGVAWVYSVVATVAPGIFPDSFRSMGGTVDVYFEAAAVITVLVLLGQVLELRAREKTSGAIKALLDLTPKTAHRLDCRWLQKRRSPSTSYSSATGCGSGRESRCPSTAPSKRVDPLSMSRWSPASPCRSPRRPVMSSSAAPSTKQVP